MASTVAVCGIDLGTTTSALSLYFPATKSKKEEVSIIRLGKQGDTIPSVVCRSPSTQIWKAGENALAEADKDRANTPVISRAKRLVGLQYADISSRYLEHMPLVREGKAGGDLEGRPVFALGMDLYWLAVHFTVKRKTFATCIYCMDLVPHTPTVIELLDGLEGLRESVANKSPTDLHSCKQEGLRDATNPYPHKEVPVNHYWSSLDTLPPDGSQIQYDADASVINVLDPTEVLVDSSREVARKQRRLEAGMRKETIEEEEWVECDAMREYLSRVDGARELDLKMYRRPFPDTEGEQESSHTTVDKHADRVRKHAKITIKYQGKTVTSAGRIKNLSPSVQPG